MRSITPKVLHRVCGQPMVAWVLDSLKEAGIASSVLVVGAEHRPFEDFFGQNPHLSLAVQESQRGTADAVAAAAYALVGATPPPYAAGRLLKGPLIQASHVLICAADTPALPGEELRRFVALHQDADVAVLGVRPPDPTGYGRLLMGGEGANAQLLEIVEERDATPDQRRVGTVNSGVILARVESLFDLLAKVEPGNAQGEYYLTDVVKLAHAVGLKTRAHVADGWRSFAGVNDRRQLASVEQWIIQGLRDNMMDQGVTMHLPETIYIEKSVEVGSDSELWPGVRLLGKTVVGRGSFVGAGATLRDAQLGEGVKVGEGAVVIGATIESGRTVPPLAIVGKN